MSLDGRQSNEHGPASEKKKEPNEAAHITWKDCHFRVVVLKVWFGGFQGPVRGQNYFHNNGKMLIVFFTRLLSQVYGGVFQRLCDLWYCKTLNAEQLSPIKARL